MRFVEPFGNGGPLGTTAVLGPKAPLYNATRKLPLICCTLRLLEIPVSSYGKL
jgi:hypothetical protein